MMPLPDLYTQAMMPPPVPHDHVWTKYSDQVEWCQVVGCIAMRPRTPQTVEMPAVAKGGDHRDDGKSMVQLVDSTFIEAIGHVMAFGAKKYARENWRGGIHLTRLVGSVLRHTYAFMRREDKDPESGLPHLAHAGASLMMLYVTWTKRSDLDDRWKETP